MAASNDNNGHTGKTPTPPPRWDLSDLFSAKDAPELSQSIDGLTKLAKKFSKKYKGNTAHLSGAQFGQAIKEYEEICEGLSRIYCFAGLMKSVDVKETPFEQEIIEKLKPAEQSLLFFTLEINALDEADILDKISAPALAEYAPWLRDIRSARQHQLSEELEGFIHDKAVTGTAAWVRLFDETMANMSFDFQGKQRTQTEMMGLMYYADDPKLRHAAFEAFADGINQKMRLFAMITNTLAKDKAEHDELRGFKEPENSRHLANQIEGAVVETMADSVRESYSKISHRYYTWKAKKFKQAKLHPADRNAPLPGEKPRVYTWDEAKEIILAGYRKFSPEMAEIAEKFFDNGWIDAEPRPGKRGGAFSHPAVPSVHPYVMVNFNGAAGDVMTLAHELGHGVHQYLAAEKGLFKSRTPLTLAETASVFGEMLVFQEMYARETDLAARRTLLANKIEDMLNTVVRQVAFYSFEQKVHRERREKGELSAKRLGEIWLEVQKDSLGPGIDTDAKGMEAFWATIPHFIHSPFYVYSYAFGVCLVNALYETYKDGDNKPEFVENYKTLLQDGGTKRHRDALRPFGLDASDADFWKKGLSMIERYTDVLVAIDQKLEVLHKIENDFNDASTPEHDGAKPPPIIVNKPKP